MKITLKEKYITLKPAQRLHQCTLPLIGLTGGIATGKTTVSNLIKAKNISVTCADQLVKRVYAKETSHQWIRSNFPKCYNDGSINFKKLREKAFSDLVIKKELESFIYPQLENEFNHDLLKIKNEAKQDFVIYDIPLLFEKNYQRYFDQIVCVFSSKVQQLSRLQKRDGISFGLSEKILKSQKDITYKKEKSNFVILNTKDLKGLTDELSIFINKIIQ